MAPWVCYMGVDKSHGDVVCNFFFFLEVTKPAVKENLVLFLRGQAEVEFPLVLTQPIRNVGISGKRKQLFQHEYVVLG